MLTYNALVHKAFLESRPKLPIALIWAAGFLASAYTHGGTPIGVRELIGAAAIIAAVLAIVLSGTGVSFSHRKSLRGATLYTYSLPVSRFQILFSRVALGWLELAGAIAALTGGMWILFPVLRASATPAEMLQYIAVLAACASIVYCIPMLFGTFLGYLTRMSASLTALGALWLLFYCTAWRAPANIFRAMGEGSPVLAHAIPWTATVLSLCFAALLFFAALRIVQTREY